MDKENIKTNMQNQPKIYKSPGIAVILSLLVPGFGQMYCERIGRGVVFLVCAIAGYIFFVVPGLVVAVLAAWDAYKIAKYGENNIQLPIIRLWKQFWE